MALLAAGRFQQKSLVPSELGLMVALVVALVFFIDRHSNHVDFFGKEEGGACCHGFDW